MYYIKNLRKKLTGLFYWWFYGSDYSTEGFEFLRQHQRQARQVEQKEYHYGDSARNRVLWPS